MAFGGNRFAVFNHCFTGGADRVAGITRFGTGGRFVVAEFGGMAFGGDRLAGFHRCSADGADIIAGVTFFGAGRVFLILNFGGMAFGRNFFTGFYGFTAVDADFVAGIAFFGAGRLCGVLKLRIFMGTCGIFQSDLICPRITAILGNCQNADDTVYRGKNGDTCVAGRDRFNGFTDGRIFQLIIGKTCDPCAVHGNTAQRRRAVVFEPPGVSHDFNFGDRHAVRSARSVLVLYRDPERHGVDHFFKSIAVFRAERIVFDQFFRTADIGKGLAVQRISKRHRCRFRRAAVVVVINIHTGQKLRRIPGEGYRGRIRGRPVIPVAPALTGIVPGFGDFVINGIQIIGLFVRINILGQPGSRRRHIGAFGIDGFSHTDTGFYGKGFIPHHRCRTVYRDHIADGCKLRRGHRIPYDGELTA